MKEHWFTFFNQIYNKKIILHAKRSGRQGEGEDTLKQAKWAYDTSTMGEMLGYLQWESYTPKYV
jgi:hypothetical protein